MILTSHWDAARVLHVPYLDLFFSKYFTHEDYKPEVTVTDYHERFRSKTHKIHLCSVDLPPDASWSTQAGFVTSPEHLFMQLSYEVNDIQKAILLGSMMCSPGENGEIPLTTIDKLTEFVQKTRWVRCRPRALDAVPYLEENFYSPMEILMYMLFCLPYHLGGVGFRKKVLINAKLTISKKDAKRLGLKRYYLLPDLLFPEYMVIIEFDGRENHSSKKAIEYDKLRRQILEEMGYTVIVIQAIDLYDLEKFSAHCHQIASLLKCSIEPSSCHFAERQATLRALLPNINDDYPWKVRAFHKSMNVDKQYKR